MDSKNDPRSVDWAPEQIAALKERLNGLVSDTASEIESLREGIKTLSEQGNVDRDRINELQAAIASKVRSELSAGFRVIGDPNLSEGAIYAGPPDVFSPPIGRASDTSDKTHLRKKDVPLGFRPEPYKGIGTGGVVQYEETWSKGYAAGVAAARDEMESRLISALDRLGWRSGSPAWLGVMGVFHADPSQTDVFAKYIRISQAEARVRNYMTNHFSTGTIEGVLAAIRDKETPPIKAKRRPIKDNPQG